MKKLSPQSLIIIVLAMVLIVPNVFANSDKFPSRNIEFIVASSPGGTADRLIRMMKNIMLKHKLVNVPITVVNKPGGAGIVGGTYLLKKKGDGHALFIVNELLFLNYLYGRTPTRHTEYVTPLATLVTEWCSLAVRADSKYQTAIELMEDLKKNPKAVSIGLVSLGSDHHLSVALAAMKFGINPKELKIVSYLGSGEIPASILGGHVEVISTSPSVLLEHKRAGKVRYLAIAADKRQSGELSDVPTWKEMGYDIEFPHWKGVVGPPEMPANAIAWWDKTLAKFVKTPEWQGIMKKLGWEDFHKNAHDTAKFFEKNYKTYEILVDTMELGKKK